MAELRSRAEGLLADLTDEQRDAVTTSATPLCILAGAGSGKTRVLTRRIAWQAATGAVDPRRVLAVTFTRRAAGELRRRLRGLGLSDEPAAGTFHAVALAMLRRYWSENRMKPPTVLHSRTALLRDLRPRGDWRTLAAIDGEIGWARARMVTPDDYPAAAAAARRRVPSLRAAVVADAYRAYDAAKQRRRLADFDDILALAHRTLSQDRQFAAAQQWCQRHLLIDEFQDVNPLQFEVLKAWLGDESTLAVVGDPQQAIYAWNGAEPDLLADIDRHLPGVAVTSLSTNFRSTPEILDTAARLAGSDAQPAAQPRGEDPTVREVLGRLGAAAARPAAARPGPSRRELAQRIRSGNGDAPDVTALEAAGIARAVRGAHRPGAPWGHQAVLARTNDQLPPIQQALARAGIPVRTRSTRSLIRNPEVEDRLGAYDRSEPLSLLVADLAAEVTSAGPADGLGASATPDRSEPPGAAAPRGRLGSADGEQPDRSALLACLVELAQDALALDPASSVADFADSLRSEDGPAPQADGVDVGTFHQAKGLEWPIVHLAGVEDGYVPHYRSRTRTALAEERRLLYVAATRAERELHISWCRLRKVGDEVVERRPSRWIEALVEESSAAAAGRSEAAVAATALARLRAARSAVDAPASAEPAELDPVTPSAPDGPLDPDLACPSGSDPSERNPARRAASEVRSTSGRRSATGRTEPAASVDPDPADSQREAVSDGTGRRTVRAPSASSAASQRETVLDALLDWRARAARNASVEPSAVLADETLHRLAALRPACLDELAAVEGVGAPQARRFGPRIIEITSPG